MHRGLNLNIFVIFCPAPVRGSGSRRNIAMPFGAEKLEWLAYPVVKKNLKMCLFVFTQFTNVTDTQTDRHRMTA